MFKSYVGIKNGHTTGCIGGDDLSPEAALGYLGDAGEVQAVPHAEAVPSGYPVALFGQDWRLLPENQWAALGYDQEGVPLPTEAELAVQVLEAEAEALAQKAALNAGYGAKLEQEAEQAALAELIAERKAAKLAALQQEHAGTLERAEARAAEYAAAAMAKKEKTNSSQTAN